MCLGESTVQLAARLLLWPLNRPAWMVVRDAVRGTLTSCAFTVRVEAK